MDEGAEHWEGGGTGIADVVLPCSWVRGAGELSQQGGCSWRAGMGCATAAGTFGQGLYGQKRGCAPKQGPILPPPRCSFPQTHSEGSFPHHTWDGRWMVFAFSEHLCSAGAEGRCCPASHCSGGSGPATNLPQCGFSFIFSRVQHMLCAPCCRRELIKTVCLFVFPYHQLS